MSKSSLRYQLKSFTIIELITVMILSGIVISIGYLSYSIVNNRLVTFNSSSNKLRELSLFSRTVKSDFHRSEKVMKTSYGFECTQEKQIVQYDVQYDYTIRSTDIKSDTFYVQVATTRYLNHKNEYASGDDEITQALFTINQNERQIDMVIHRASNPLSE